MTKPFELEPVTTTVTAATDPVAIEAARLRKRAEPGRALTLRKEAHTIASDNAEPTDGPDPGEPIA